MFFNIMYKNKTSWRTSKGYRWKNVNNRFFNHSHIGILYVKYEEL